MLLEAVIKRWLITGLASLLLSGCVTLAPYTVTGGQITFFTPAAQTPVALTAAQRQFVQDWLDRHRGNWAARYAPTLTPGWCLRADGPQDRSLSLCRYGASVVLRGVGPEVERKLGADDEAQFAAMLEPTRGAGVGAR